MTPQAALARLVDGGDLGEEDVRGLLAAAVDGAASAAQLAGILVALRMKGETAAELAGAARFLRERAVAVPGAPVAAIDTCGTGGDGARTFNISTGAALVAAAAGAPVAKHGNRAVSGAVGSADVLEALGVTIELPPAALADCLRQVGFAFLYAPALQPALRTLGPVRRDLGVRTLFNLLGPLANPAGVRRQVIGVGDPRRTRTLAEVLAALGVDHAWVVHGPRGLDELGLDGASTVVEVTPAGLRTFEVVPADLGLAPAPITSLQVATVAQSADYLRSVLAGELGAARDAVCLNAAAALVVAGIAVDLADGLARAAAAIDAGAAAGVLARLVAFTGAHAPREGMGR